MSKLKEAEFNIQTNNLDMHTQNAYHFEQMLSLQIHSLTSEKYQKL